jgi:hypothetical protein
MSNFNKKSCRILTLFLLLTIAFSAVTLSSMTIAAEEQEIQIETEAYLSFRPNPVGLNQPFLVNIWITPATHVQRSISNYYVTITKPSGEVDEVGPITSYQGDVTAWFEYTADEVGQWTIQFNFKGDHLPALNTTASMFSTAGHLPPVYYKPSSSPVLNLTVQQDMVASWPPSTLPTDFWTRPVSPENREWAIMIGNFPFTGYLVNPPENTNRYASNYRFTPYVQGPVTAHVAWKQLGALSGLIGGDMGTTMVGSGEGTYAGTPSVVFNGRCYQSITAPGGQDVLRCYDLRTGEIYWEISNPIPGSQGFFGYTPGALTGITVSKGSEVVPGATSSAVGQQTALIAVGSNLVKINPYNGAITLNTTGMTGTYYRDPFVLSVQTVKPGVYRLINWTTAGTSTNFTSRIISNITWPFSSLGVVDYEAGVAVSASPITPPEFGAWYGSVIAAADLYTGALKWNVTDTDTIYSTSTAVADHGKFAVCMMNRHWNAYSLMDGSKLWESEKADYPWGFGWGYTVGSAYGKLIGLAYDGVYAFNWDDGSIAWKFSAGDAVYETPYNTWSWMSSPQIADGKVYVGNGEHSPTSPITRGWRLFCINASTGEGIWNVTGGMTSGAVADGYLTADNRYDGYMYVFGKGQTKTTVSTPQTQLLAGQKAIITGTVLDQSPAQPGTPCVNKESMTQWMEYLHMQHSVPADVIGVPISIDAVDPNGNAVHIADVTSDMSGTFSYTWSTQIAGDYKITATFMGDDSYGSSWAQTYATVVEASSTPAPTSSTVVTQEPVGLYIAASTIAIIIAVALVGLMLRKRP